MSGGITKLTRAQKTEQQQAMFACEYIKDFNGKQAAIRSGYSERSAAQTASRLLNQNNVQKILTAALEERRRNNATDADKALAMVESVADADPNALMEMRRGCCRYCHGHNGDYQYTRQELRKAQDDYSKVKEKYDNALMGMDAAKREGLAYPPFDMKGGIGFNPNEKPNPECTECFGEGEVRTFIKDTRTLTDAERRLFGGIKETQHGVEIKVNSQDKSRELLMRHHGLLNDKLGLGNPDGTNFSGSVPASMVVNFITVEAKKAAE